jgi:hypothetical protein
MYSQNSSVISHADSVKALKKIITASNTLASAGVGFAGTPSPSWYSFAYLVSIANTNELLDMSRDDNPALRLYAFTGLLYKNYKHIDEVKKRMNADTAIVSVLSGCIMSLTTVAKAASTVEWYSPKGIEGFIQAVKTDKVYGNELFRSLVNNRSIKRFATKGL